MARELATTSPTADDFVGQAIAFTRERPEITHLTWLDARRRVKASHSAMLYQLDPGGVAPAARTSGGRPRDRTRGHLPRRARHAARRSTRAPSADPRCAGVPVPHPADRAGRLRRHPGRRVFGRGPGAPLRPGRRRATAHDLGGRRTAERAGRHRDRPARPAQPPRTDRQRRAADARRSTACCCAARAGAQHRPDQQHAVLDGGGAVGADGVDAAGHLAPHAPAQPDPGRAGAGDQFPPRHGELACPPACARWTSTAASPTSTPPSAR